MIPEPESPYAITKLDGEHYLAMFQREGRLETAAIRLFNVFGPARIRKGAYAAAVPSFIEKALRNEDITIHGDGEQTRDFIYVKDIASALSFAVETPGVTGVFNAGYGGQTTVNDLARHIVASAASSSRILHRSERSGDVKHSRASVEKLIDAGWAPRYSLAEGLEMTLDFFKSLTV